MELTPSFNTNYILVQYKSLSINSNNRKGYYFTYRKIYPPKVETETEFLTKNKIIDLSVANTIEYTIINFSDYDCLIDNAIILAARNKTEINKHIFKINTLEADQSFHNVIFIYKDLTPTPPDDCCLTQLEVYQALQAIFNGNDLNGNPNPTDIFLFLQSSATYLENIRDLIIDYANKSVFKDNANVSVFKNIDTTSVFKSGEEADISVFNDLTRPIQESVFKDQNKRSVFIDYQEISVFKDTTDISWLQKIFIDLNPEAQQITFTEFYDTNIGALIALYDGWKVGGGYGKKVFTTNFFIKGTQFYLVIGYLN